MTKKTTNCPDCGAELFAHRDACSQCGARLPPSGVEDDTKYCQQCGQQLRSDAEFCDRCGGDQSDRQQRTRQQTQSQSGGGLTRRQIIAGGVGVVAIAGVGVLWVQSSGATHQSAGQDAWQSRETRSTTAGEAVHGTVVLNEGEYIGQQFWTEGVYRLGVSVDRVEGGPVDCWAIADDDIDAYRDGDDNLTHNPQLSEEGLSGPIELIDTVPSGEWWVVFDNTGAYGTPPDGDVTVEFTAGVGL